MADFRIPRLRRRVKRALVVTAGVGIAFTGFFFARSFSSSAKAVSEQIRTVQPVSELPMLAAAKQVPEKYNGQVRKIAYLTFDDGPNEYTESLLNILKSNGVQATFFMIGAQIPSHKDSINRLVAEGNYPALHSMTHNYQKLYNEGQIVNEMKQAQTILQEATGIHSDLTRCPYGSMPGLTSALRDQMAAAGLKEWDWTIDSLDWKLANNPNGIVQNVLTQSSRNLEVILLHEKKQTLQVLPEVIAGLRSEGYEFEVYDPAAHFSVNFWHDNRL
jgi:peptidoglycan/xylan/chitin deacetylase (PgdA/CDA1 family)